MNTTNKILFWLVAKEKIEENNKRIDELTSQQAEIEGYSTECGNGHYKRDEDWIRFQSEIDNRYGINEKLQLTIKKIEEAILTKEIQK